MLWGRSSSKMHFPAHYHLDKAGSMNDLSAAPQGDGAPEILMVSVSHLAAAMRAELVEFFHDGVSPTLGRYGVDHIVGGVIQRVCLTPDGSVEV